MASGSGASSSGNANNSGSLAKDDSKWYFTAEQLSNSPSRKCGMDADQELMYRQRAANLIQDMGQRLQVSQLCINTAIVYMHRFYAFHSFTQFHRNSIAAAALFLAAKVEEQPRKLEHIIKVVHICLSLDAPDPLKENYAEQAQDLVFNENVLLQTLGFDVAIDHPHTHVVKTCHLVKASKDLAQTSYFMASNSLHLTTMCLQYKPTVVACFCIHLACKWSRWEIPQSNEGRHWFHYVDKTVTLDLLKQLTDEFLHIFDRCPTRLKSKMKLSDDSGRRSGSSTSGMPCPSSSLTARPIDDGGSSSSSHHRSSSHSQHSHSKQSSSSGDPMLKQSSSSQKVPSSSSSSSSRSRSERPSSSSSQQIHQQQMMSGSAHYGASGASVKMQPMPHHSSSRSNMPPQSSSSSSSSTRAGYMHESARDPKNRMMPSAATGSSSSSMQMHPYGQNKVDRHSSSNSSQKNQGLSHMDSKNPMKPQGPMAPLFGSGQDLPPRTSSSSMMKQPPQPPYGSHLPSYSQSMSSRNNNLPSSESVSVPNQPQQFKNQLQQPQSAAAESSFRLIDDSNRLTDPIPVCTPPKQSKPSSIFSPDWKDTQAESNNGNISNAISSNSGSKSRSQVQSTGATKPVKESPSSREKKPLPLSYTDQQQQNQKQRSETPKKERRMDPFTAQSGGTHLSRSNEKKSTSSSSSGSLKRSLESTSVPPMPLTSIADADMLGLNKPTKRSLPSNEQIRQDDGTDFRETKIRKVDGQSPSEQLFSSSFDLSNTFDKQDDGFSLFAFGDPGSLLSQPLLSDSKPIGANKNNFPNTINGIETNPALVSSLLKESLCSNESKFGTLNSGGTHTAMTGTATVSNSITSLSSHNASLSSTSSMGMPSMLSILPNVPETAKSEATPVDANAPSAISSLLAQSVASANATTSATSSSQHLPTTANLGNTAINATGSGEIQTLTGESLALPSKDDEHHRSKSEKKKKKDKHKHKEKDKSKDKDREDRKKHKKDKDRHREREKSENTGDPTLSNPPPGPIKIKLPKDKLNLPSLSEGATANNPHASDSGLKIKIPKDRLSGSSSLSTPATGPVNIGMSSAGNHQIPAPNPLKLKISKDKIEHYNISATEDKIYNSGPGHGQATGGGSISTSSSHHSHGSKKKDRERSKSSKSSTNDYNKQNGNSGAGAMSSASGSSSSKSSSTKQNAASAQQQQHPSINATAQPATGLSQYPASFDYMQHAQAPMLQQQHQLFNQFGTVNHQQQQQMQQLMINSGAALKSNPPPYYYNSNNQNNGKK